MQRAIGDTVKWKAVNGIISGVIVGIWQKPSKTYDFSVATQECAITEQQEDAAYIAKTANGVVIVNEQSII